MYNQPCPCAVHAFIKHMFLYDRANECFDLMRIFSRGGGGGIKLIHCKKIVFSFTGRREKKIVSYFALQMMTVMKRFSGYYYLEPPPHEWPYCKLLAYY